jgi:ribosomal protein S18 acetylase RimI-like enzyme
MFLISDITKEQLIIVQNLAYQIWPVAYGEILSNEQLSYMLKRFYSLEALEGQLNGGQQFVQILDQNQPIGFLAYEVNCDNTNMTKVHKIYVLKTYQGRGVGKELIDFAISKAKQNEQKGLFLNVNKYNKARFFYEKLGFSIVKEEVIDIGNTFVMDDYVMMLKF